MPRKQKLKTKNVLITGCAGQDGQLLSYAMRRRKARVFGIDVDGADGTPDFVVRIRGWFTDHGILDDGSLWRAIEVEGVSEIYHLAAMTNPRDGESRPHDMVEANIVGTLNVFEAVRKCGKPVKVLYVASDNAFGDGDGDSVQTEFTPMRPKELYGVTKATVRMLAEVYRGYGLDIRGVVPYNHSSKVQQGDFLLKYVAKEIVRICSEMKEGKRPRAISMRSQLDTRDFVHAKDMVEAMIIIMSRGETTDYLVGSGVPRTIESIVYDAYEVGVEKFGLTNALPPEQVIDFEAERSDLLNPRPDLSKISALNWCPMIPFRKLLEEMIDDQLRQAG